jgi:hypothetical protein
VCAVRVLRPGRIVTIARCRWILELPIDHPTPAVGARVDVARLRPIRGRGYPA